MPLTTSASMMLTQLGPSRPETTSPQMRQELSPVHSHILSLLDAREASAVLDVGCGHGQHLQFLTSEVSAATHLVGIDSSEKSIATARATAGTDPRLTFLMHDLGKGIPFADGAFDRILSVNVLEAIQDKTALLRDMHRVLSPEGRVVVSHYDWDSQFYDGVDKALVRRLVHAFGDWQQRWMADADAWMGRRLWRTLQETGLFEGWVDAYVHTSTRFEPGEYGWERSRDFGSMVKRGLITAEEYDRFYGALQDLADRDQYFYAITMFSFVGAKASS